MLCLCVLCLMAIVCLWLRATGGLGRLVRCPRSSRSFSHPVDHFCLLLYYYYAVIVASFCCLSKQWCQSRQVFSSGSFIPHEIRQLAKDSVNRRLFIFKVFVMVRTARWLLWCVQQSVCYNYTACTHLHSPCRYFGQQALSNTE